MKIAVIGSINIDMTATVDRIPLIGETIKGKQLTYSPGGKGANQAVAMAKMGADVEMFGCVGDDANGIEMIKNLEKYNIKTDNIKVVKGVSTGTALIAVGENDNTIIVIGGANEKVDLNYFESIKENLKQFDMVVMQFEIPLDTIINTINYCYENKIKVLLNPAPALDIPKSIIEKVEYLIPNESEAKLIFKDDNLENILKQYPEKVLVTMGSKGVGTYLKSGEMLVVPPRKTKVVDTTGAGDTLNAGFAVKICEGADIKTAMQYANISASMSIEKFGAQAGMPTKEEVEKEWRNYNV